MMRFRACLLAAVAPLAFIPSALATDISDERTVTLRTSTVAGGSAGSVNVLASGAVRVASGDAVVMDSDNDVANAGAIVTEGDDAVAIRITNGRTANVSNGGTITISDGSDPVDTDNDGDFDGPFAIGTGRFGILIEGSDPFTGSVTNTGSISVEGNNSGGIRSDARIVGDFSSSGNITVTGDNNTGVALNGGVTGNAAFGGNIRVFGADSTGISIGDNVSGATTFSGVVSSTGFREVARRGSDAALALLDADDLLTGGPAVAIGGSLAGGILIAGPSDDDASVIAAQILSFGSAPALLISAGYTEGRNEDLVIGLIADDTDGFVNRGTISSSGVNDGFAATAVRIGGGTPATIIEGGLRNENSISSIALAANSTAIDWQAGASAPALRNSGTIAANGALLTAGQSATAVSIAAGASLNQIVNSGVLSAASFDTEGDAFVIRDASGTLTLVENTGGINATNTGTGRAVAIQATHDGATTIRQYIGADGFVPRITGDIELGGGDDVILLEAGQLFGDVDFGTGSDVFTLNADSEFSGSITDADGDLALTLTGAIASIRNAAALNLQSLTVASDSDLRFLVDATGSSVTATRLNVAGTADISSEAMLSPILQGLPADTVNLTIISAGSLVSDGTISDQLNDQTPFLYSAELAISTANPNDVILTLRRRTTDEMGLGNNQSVAFDAIFSAIRNDTDLSSGIASAITQEEFTRAYTQFFPEYAGAALQFAVANLDSSIGAVANRLDVIRAGGETSYGAWAQEFTTFQDREGAMGDPGFRGNGIGFAAGIDRAFGPFYALGVSASVATSNIEEAGGFDEPLSASSVHFGTYAAAARGNLLLDTYLGAGFDFYESERELQFASVSRVAESSWGGHHLSASARIAYDLTSERFFARPALSVDYITMTERSHQEWGGGAGVDLFVDERSGSVGAATAQLTLGAMFGDRERFWWSPRIRAGYRSEFSSDLPETAARFVGSTDVFTLVPDEMPDSGVIAGLSLTTGGQHSSFSLDYDADIREAYMRHVLRVAFRLLF
jgi:uncharacterized protein with beta-barrel porin domain